jgi:hypothetical protein
MPQPPRFRTHRCWIRHGRDELHSDQRFCAVALGTSAAEKSKSRNSVQLTEPESRVPHGFPSTVDVSAAGSKVRRLLSRFGLRSQTPGRFRWLQRTLWDGKSSWVAGGAWEQQDGRDVHAGRDLRLHVRGDLSILPSAIPREPESACIALAAKTLLESGRGVGGGPRRGDLSVDSGSTGSP